MGHSSYPAFHVLWTKPATAGGKRFGMNKAELLTTVISALMWQQYNGSIKLYTDAGGYEFIREQGLTGLWDGGIDTKVLGNNSYPIDPEIFWAAGKLIALEAQASPCVMLDTDLIVMHPIHPLLHRTSITALHPEKPEPDVYLKPSRLKCPGDFKFPESYDWNVLPSNTAFLYIRNESFKQSYLNEAKRFMFHNTEKPAEAVSQMVFAEQRLLSICAAEMKLPVNYLLTDPFSLSNNTVIHLWGFKNVLRQNDKIQAIYARQLIKRVEDELSANVFFRDYTWKHFGRY